MAVGRLSEAEKKQIEDCVAQVEKKCAGEIVPVILQESDDYPGARWRMAVAFSLLSSFLLYTFSTLEPLWILTSQFPSLYAGYLLSQISFLKRFFLAEYKKEEEVYQRALEAFWTHGVSKTRERTGILIFISLLERKARILCDTGIQAKVDQEDWQAVLDKLIDGIRKKTLVSSMCTTIEECGAIVENHFPPRKDDTNELSNTVILD